MANGPRFDRRRWATWLVEGAVMRRCG